MKRFFQRGLCDAAIRSAVGALLLFGCTAVSQADIYQWTYAANGYTIIQSTTLCPGGAGVSAVPGVDLSSRDLTKAALWNTNLSAANLSNVILANAYATNCNLTNAELAGATLDGTDFFGSSLQGADFTGATVTGTNFLACGLISAQLYSTASYKNHDLVGIDLSDEEMTGWNFVDQDLSYAVFSEGHRGMDYADLTGANLSYAKLAPHMLNANFTDAILRNAQLDLSSLGSANFTNADLTNATIKQTDFGHTNLTSSQLYSTADYKAQYLNKIGLSYTNLAGWNFAGQNLGYADFTSSTLTGADFTAADLRGATGASLSGAITRNTILANGTINNLSLRGGEKLVVRNSDIPIHAAGATSLDPAATLQFLFDGNPYPYNGTWNSTISFDSGSSLTLAGTLELTFYSDTSWTSWTSLVGEPLHLFDWTHVNHSGSFSVVADEGTWDLSHLYTTGVVTLTAVPEPGTLALLVAAGLGLAAIGWRRASRKQALRTLVSSIP